jgi:hypothetical protein
MKRKTIYALILICFAGLISSANQTSKECTTTNALCCAQKGACPASKASNAKEIDSPAVPLNLLLFDL